MTKAQALKTFKAEILPQLRRGDRAEHSFNWGVYTDGLCRDGLITSKQYHSWTNPFAWKPANY